MENTRPNRVPWYLWPIVFPVFLVAGVVMFVPLALLALWALPFFWLNPERHMHIYDEEGTAHQRMRLQQWRDAYAKLSFGQRIRRAIKVSLRRRRQRRLKQRGA
jgi:hypothetical protein